MSSASASTAPDSLLDSGGRSESRVDSLGDTQLEDVAFPVSTFVNRANQVDDSERASTGDSPSSGSDNPFASSSTLSPHCDASSVCTDRSQACATARSLVKTCKQRSPAGKFPKSSSKAQVVTSNESTSDNGLHACERQTCGMHATETSGDQKEMAASSKQVQAQGAVFESDAGVTVSLSVSHSRAEGTAPKFQCPHCARSCTRATVLMDHRAKAHGEKNLFKCSQCCYEGHLFGHLQKHMKRRHGCSITSFQPVKLNGDRIAISPERICDQADQNDDDVECANVFSSQKSDFRPLGDKIKVGDVLLKQKLLHMFMSCDQKHHKKNRWTGKVKLVSLLKRQTGFVSALPEVSHSSCSITAKNVVSSASTKVAHKLVSRTQTVDSEKTSKPMEDTELEKCPKDPPITSTSTETHSDSEGETDSFTSSGTQRNFPCDQCSRTFRQKRSLVAHLNTHSGVLPFACSTCAKNFSCKNLLQQHEKSHWTQKPHRCSAEGCHRAFRTSTRYKAALNFKLAVRSICSAVLFYSSDFQYFNQHKQISCHTVLHLS